MREPSEIDSRRDKRRTRWMVRAVGITSLGLIGAGVIIDQTQLDGMITGGIGHKAGVLVHDGAIGIEDAARWVADNTPAN